MKKVFALFTALVVAAFVLNGYIAQASNQDNFWAQAAQGGMAEVELSNLALQKSQNDQVKEFAQKMVDEHTAVNDELKTLAAGKNVTLPTDVNAKQQSTMDKLNGRSGADFDKEYIKTMVKDHEAMVKLFEKQADRGTDTDAKAFAAKTLPSLRSHLEMARSMNNGMKNMSGGNSGDSMGSNSNKMMNSNKNSNSSGTMMESDQTTNSNMSSNSNKNMKGNMNSNRNMNSNNMNSNRNKNSNSNSNSNDNMNSNSNVNGY